MRRAVLILNSTQTLFDSRMAQYQTAANVTIHLGPGTFENKGVDATSNTGAWQASRGMGIDVTELKLKPTSPFSLLECPRPVTVSPIHP